MEPKNREIIDNWGNLSETRKNSILGYLLVDNATPKSFSEIRKYCEQKHICSGNTLWVYLDKLEREEKRIIKVPNGKRFKYAMVDYEDICEGLEKYKAETEQTNKRTQKFINKIIKVVNSGTLSDREVKTLVNGILLDLEYIQLLGLKKLVDNKIISGIIAPTIIEDYFITPFNLRIQFVWACYEKYKTHTNEAMTGLMNSKTNAVKESYGELLKKIGINIEKNNQKNNENDIGIKA
jgi:hypothetical protein